MAESHKEFTLKDRPFRAGRFSARDGSFIALKVGGLLAPVFSGITPSAQAGDVPVFDMLGKLTANLTESEFAYIQGKCLGVCEEKMMAGWTKVVNPDGTFAVFDMEDNTILVLSLTVQALVFNLSDFFGENGLTELFSAISPMSLPS